MYEEIIVKENDIIKLGRVRLKFDKIVITSEDNFKLTLNLKGKKNIF
mgnify:CR=1 FL=1